LLEANLAQLNSPPTGNPLATINTHILAAKTQKGGMGDDNQSGILSANMDKRNELLGKLVAENALLSPRS
jgi:hypothetical protein